MSNPYKSKIQKSLSLPNSVVVVKLPSPTESTSYIRNLSGALCHEYEYNNSYLDVGLVNTFSYPLLSDGISPGYVALEIADDVPCPYVRLFVPDADKKYDHILLIKPEKVKQYRNCKLSRYIKEITDQTDVLSAELKFNLSIDELHAFETLNRSCDKYFASVISQHGRLHPYVTGTCESWNSGPSSGESTHEMQVGYMSLELATAISMTSKYLVSYEDPHCITAFPLATITGYW